MRVVEKYEMSEDEYFELLNLIDDLKDSIKYFKRVLGKNADFLNHLFYTERIIDMINKYIEVDEDD